MTVNVILTALPPTKGHEDLVRFAKFFAQRIDQTLKVVVYYTLDEPLAGHYRQIAFHKEFASYDAQIDYYEHNLPDKPRSASDTLFWEEWVSLIKESGSFSKRQPNYLIASEPYGMKLAEMLNVTFIPYDMNREMRTVSATMVREKPLENFHMLMESVQHVFRKRVVLFGAESTGKTTMAKRLAKEMNGLFVPEWARGYLETVGPELTKQKMMNIFYGQLSLESTALEAAVDKPFIFCDTDIHSTFGYAELKNYDLGSASLLQYVVPYPHLYIVMNSGIPFEADPLRYGGDRRESTDKFWLDHLKYHLGGGHYDKRVVYMPAGTHEEQFQFAKDTVLKLFEHDLWSYKR